MGRSKFPGKPSKHVNRTRINVLSTDLAYVTTVVDDTNAGVVTVVEGDNSKKEDDLSKPFESELRTRKTRKKRVSLTNKLTPHKKSILLSDSPLNASTQRLTRSKVVSRRSFTFTNRKTTKPKLRASPTKKESTKFILPSRSVHSSRVIKPNKRFINVDQSDVRIKKRILNKRQCVKSVYKENNLSDNCDSNSETSSSAVTHSAPSTISSETPTKSTQSPPLNRRVVLRKARLQIKSKTPLGTEGPFSIKTSGGVPIIPTTVTCGVCGAIRFYRFVKQARKFNIYSCESCRKFISKQIQISNDKNSNTVLNCHKGQGACIVPPIVRSQQWKFNKLSYNSRCPACWLKLCLRSFQIPLALKTSLSQLLPKNMQLCDTLFSTSLPLLTWQSQLSESKSAELQNKTSPITENTLRQRPVRNIVKKDEKPKEIVPAVDIKRPKIDNKGPRVKHVCRSASIVLGQPLAVFPDDKPKIIEPIPVAKVIIKPIEIVAPVAPIPPEIEIVQESIDPSIDTDDPECTSATEDEIPLVILKTNIIKTEAKKLKNGQSTTLASLNAYDMTKPCFKKKPKVISPQIDTNNLVDIHYWENYDPDEVVRNGFSITGSETFPMQALCYLCGSAGNETLLHCCVCCEPYHPYCLEQCPPNFKNTKQKYTWVCPKCTACAACGDADRQKIHCQKCHKAYHPQCFNSKWRTDDRPTVCSNCLRCKSCGTDNITKFIGNLALCLICFKLRNKGNFCPICQCCYDDNDFDTKMMECGKCFKWVHAKCEGLSDEQYQILSILPETVEFLCCLCSNTRTPFWRKAIQVELKSCFNNILRLLSKNRVAREMLKLSPLKSFTPVLKQLYSARKLQFPDSDSETLALDKPKNDENATEITNELEQVNNIFKNKIDFGESFKSPGNTPNGDSKFPISPNMLELRNKMNCNEYFSLREFNEGMEQALTSAESNELLTIYRSILKNVFPWFDPTVKPDLNQSVCEVSSYKEEDTKFKYDTFDVYVTNKLDKRPCGLCKGIGDGLSEKESRLLYCGQNEWIHANCALWSSEVYEEIDGSLQNVQGALSRGRKIRCSYCKLKGASVGCCLKGCNETFHFPCAQSVNCIFVADKTIYCRKHEVSEKFNVIQNATEFEIRRSVYVEIDGKKRKFYEPEHVNFMVGSLSVFNLGKIIPCVSDHEETIIPVGFVCQRLFWSTTEPWKLVPYTITTSLFNSNERVYVDKNFTVDHTLSRNIVDKKLRDISMWMREPDSTEFDFEEPQNSASDILSPELTDAILEELPHDLLDGITWNDQEMLMEELLNMDFKNAEINYNDNLSMNMNSDNLNKNNESAPQSESKLLKLDDNKFDESPKPSPKSPDDKKLDKPRNPPRCSLTWLQLDNSLSPAMKKRKVMPPRDKNMYLQLLQVDGNCDSSSSECGSPTHEIEEQWEPANDEPVTCVKCSRTYRTLVSYRRHLPCDSVSTSESETEADLTHEGQIITTDNPIFFNYQPTNHTQIDNSSAIYCVVSDKHNLSMNQPLQQVSIGLNRIVEHASLQESNMQQSMNIQSIPYTQDLSQMLNPQVSQGITIGTKMLAQNVVNSIQNIPQNQWSIRPIIKQTLQTQQNKTRGRIVVKKSSKIQNVLLPQSSQSMILQHLPNMQNTNLLPYVDAYTHQEQQQQNVQYITTLAPQMNSTITTQSQLIGNQPQILGNQSQLLGNQNQLIGNQQQLLGNQAQLIGNQLIANQALVQMPGDNNFLTLVNNVQPMILQQQPNNNGQLNGQIIVDASGQMVWAPAQPVQPIYYGFETIVQNTVMQSQQYLPTTVPGVLAANSSYSATTQVFQTSKLEPVLDGNNFVLVNNQNGIHHQHHNGLQIVNQNTNTSRIQHSTNTTSSQIQSSIQQSHSTNTSHIQQSNMQQQNMQQQQNSIRHQQNSVHQSNIQRLQLQQQNNIQLQQHQNSMQLQQQLIQTSPIQRNNTQTNPIPQHSIQTSPIVQHRVHTSPIQQHRIHASPIQSPNLHTSPIQQQQQQHRIESSPIEQQQHRIQANQIQQQVIQTRPMQQHASMNTRNMQQTAQPSTCNKRHIQADQTKLHNMLLPFIQPNEAALPSLHSIDVQSQETQLLTMSEVEAAPLELERLYQHNNLLQQSVAPPVNNVQPSAIQVAPPIQAPIQQAPASVQDGVQPSPNNQHHLVMQPNVPIIRSSPMTIASNVQSTPKPRAWSVQKIDTTKSAHGLKMATQQVASTIKFVPTATSTNANSITLPIAPFVRAPEQGIPTNIVPPTQKPPTSAQCRPMSRVLPMQTIVAQQKKLEKPYIVTHKPADIKKTRITILNDIVIKPSRTAAAIETALESIKLDFQEDLASDEINKPMKTETLEIEMKDVLKPNKVQMQQLKLIKPTKPTKLGNKENDINMDSLDTNKIDKKPIYFKNEGEVLDLPKLQKRINTSSINYKIESADGVMFTGASLTQLWNKIFNHVQAARLEHNLPPLPEIALRTICGFDLLALKSKGMRYLLEQLPDAMKCKTYKHIFKKPSGTVAYDDEEYDEGARRCLPYDVKQRKKYDMFSWLSSKHRALEMYDLDSVLKKGASSSLIMAMRYRTMRQISKYSVGVYRSEIHGRGLFSLRDIEIGEMVIEYCGEVIRSVLTDKRERFYNSKGIGCYMFRIDDNLVVDATMKGNAARFINHSCDPNCYSKVVDILGAKHIIIFALYPILCGEELTYDYKFPFEEDKIPCSCGTKRCRKFLN